MLGLAVVLGLICGPWIGRDLRKEFASSESRDDTPAGDDAIDDGSFEQEP
jgi:hypothetical protein